MSNNCTDQTTCADGNCVGCKNGKTWCQDPRCQPNCTGCAIPYDFDFNANILVIIVLFCLVTIFFIVWFVFGPGLFEHHDDHQRAGVLTS